MRIGSELKGMPGPVRGPRMATNQAAPSRLYGRFPSADSVRGCASAMGEV